MKCPAHHAALDRLFDLLAHHLTELREGPIAAELALVELEQAVQAVKLPAPHSRECAGCLAVFQVPPQHGRGRPPSYCKPQCATRSQRIHQAHRRRRRKAIARLAAETVRNTQTINRKS